MTSSDAARAAIERIRALSREDRWLLLVHLAKTATATVTEALSDLDEHFESHHE